MFVNIFIYICNMNRRMNGSFVYLFLYFLRKLFIHFLFYFIFKAENIGCKLLMEKKLQIKNCYCQVKTSHYIVSFFYFYYFTNS